MTHEFLCRMLEIACVYDQLDAPNTAVVELICRQIQSIEETLKDKFFDSDGLGADHFLMSGAPSRANLCIAPSLSAWVAQEAAKESAVLKERRKAREERALLKPKDPKGKGGKDPP